MCYWVKLCAQQAKRVITRKGHHSEQVPEISETTDSPSPETNVFFKIKVITSRKRVHFQPTNFFSKPDVISVKAIQCLLKLVIKKQLFIRGKAKYPSWH